MQNNQSNGQTQDKLPLSEELFSYDIKWNKEYAEKMTIDVDDRGYAYLTTDIVLEDKKAIHTIEVYDTRGECIKTAKVSIGRSSVMSRCLQETTLYCVVYDCKNEDQEYSGTFDLALYAVDLSTWEAKLLCWLEDFSKMTRIEIVGNLLFCLGTAKNVPQKTYTQYSLWEPYTYTGLILETIDLSQNCTKELLPIDFPQDIAKTPQGTLVFYLYREDIGSYFAEYVPATRELYELRQAYMSSGFVVCNEQNDIICPNGKKELVFLDMDTGETAAVQGNAEVWPTRICYEKGFVFYFNQATKQVERFSLSGALKNNKTIQVIANQHASQLPFGCGYRMEVTALDSEAFALKVLALDKDYDLCLLNSRNSIAYKLKENGVFYALNEIPGVVEYLDNCFAYIKEAATDENGDIWMLPIQVDIQGFFYNADYCAKHGVTVPQQTSFAEFMEDNTRLLEEKPDQISMFTGSVEESFFAQYLSIEDSFDTALFRQIMEQMKNYYAKTWQTSSAGYKLVQDPQTEVFYTFEQYAFSWQSYISRFGNTNHIKVCGMPRLNGIDKNPATCVFVAVNPRSKQLKETLNYLADYVAYRNQEKDSLMLSNPALYSDTPFAKELYQLYENGQITFRMDHNVYQDTVDQYFSDTIPLEDMIKEIERNRKTFLYE